MKICIDPGHGGVKRGCSFNNLYESDFTLPIALALKNMLKDKHEVVMTRESNIHISLDDRAFIANEFKADIFISVHINSVASDRPGGHEVFYADGSVQGRELATAINDSFSYMLGFYLQDRGAKSDSVRPLAVLRKTRMPAALVECCFLSNAGDRRLLVHDIAAGLLVHTIYRGIDKYASTGLNNLQTSHFVF